MNSGELWTKMLIGFLLVGVEVKNLSTAKWFWYLHAGGCGFPRWLPVAITNI